MFCSINEAIKCKETKGTFAVEDNNCCMLVNFKCSFLHMFRNYFVARKLQKVTHVMFRRPQINFIRFDSSILLIDEYYTF